jgi:hypothetical protein
VDTAVRFAPAGRVPNMADDRDADAAGDRSLGSRNRSVNFWDSSYVASSGTAYWGTWHAAPNYNQAQSDPRDLAVVVLDERAATLSACSQLTSTATTDAAPPGSSERSPQAARASETPLRTPDSPGDVWIMNADGSDQRPLTSTDVIEGFAGLATDPGPTPSTACCGAIFEPSGDQLGEESSTSSCVSRVTPLPSALAVKISSSPLPEIPSQPPSGDIDG